MLTDDAFDQSRFARRTPVDFDGMTVFISAAEDTILMKLKWDQESGGGGRQFHDALRVDEVRQAILDQSYLQHWVQQLQLNDSWRQLLAKAKPLP